MTPLYELYSINEDNLALRRQFLRISERDIKALRRVARWFDSSADGIARTFYDHQFAFSETRAFFEAFAKARGCSLAELRAALERAQAGYLRDVFDEARGEGDFGLDYFERRLRVGKVHNQINLPLKWYVGSYATYYDLIHAGLRRRFPHRPLLCARVDRALVAVFSLDIQAIVEAFYYDTFATMGVDITQIEVRQRSHDLSDCGAELKATVRRAVEAVVQVSGNLRQASHGIAQTSYETGRAAGEIAQAIEGVATGAEHQAQMITDARRIAEGMSSAATDSAGAARESVDAAHRTRELADEGVRAAGEASDSMLSVRDSARRAADAIRGLAEKSERIGAIVGTITGIAEQTNLLALNAAIEAARAGEEGRGFAVVAEQVRKLAESSRDAATQISGLISEVQADTSRAVDVVEEASGGTEAGVATVERVHETFDAIGAAVRDMSGRVEQIVAAMEQIAADAETMQGNVGTCAAVAEESSAASEQVSASTQQTSASAQEIAASAQELSRTADELDTLVGQFKLEA